MAVAPPKSPRIEYLKRRLDDLPLGGKPFDPEIWNSIYDAERCFGEGDKQSANVFIEKAHGLLSSAETRCVGLSDTIEIGPDLPRYGIVGRKKRRRKS